MKTDFRLNDRVQLHPSTDAWLRGLRYGSVLKIGRKYITVLTDVGKYRLRVTPDLLLHAE